MAAVPPVPRPLAEVQNAAAAPMAAQVVRFEMGHYDLFVVLQVNPQNLPNAAPAGGIGQVKTGEQIAFEASCLDKSKIMMVYVFENQTKQLVPVHQSMALLNVIFACIGKLDRPIVCADKLKELIPASPEGVRNFIKEILLAAAANLDHYPDEVAHMKLHYRAAGAGARGHAAGRMYLEMAIYEKAPVFNAIFSATLCASVIAKSPSESKPRQPGAVDDTQEFAHIVDDFKKAVYTSFHTHRDFCLFVPYERTLIRSHQSKQAEQEGVFVVKDPSRGANHFLRYFYFVEVFKDLRSTRDKDKATLLDNIPVEFKKKFSEILKNVDDKEKPKEKRRATREQDDNGPPAPKNPSINYFPGDTRAAYNALLTELAVPKDQKTIFYRELVRAKLLPGLTNGVLDAEGVKAAWNRRG